MLRTFFDDESTIKVSKGREHEEDGVVGSP